ncbi:MAG: ATP-binding protein [Acidimicrobiaceae bacterium]|nr:ATP-binding protein [Acidimicrobiaceae bacterium]
MIARSMSAQIDAGLEHFRVVVLHGPRQSGKTTLARAAAETRRGVYASLDDDATREAALDDPRSFLLGQGHPLVVDEVQLGGDRLVRSLKQVVDEDPVPGRFLLTGSTNFLTVPTLSESLAGRVRILRLWPLSQAELHGVAPPRLEHWFHESGTGPLGASDHHGAPTSRDDYFARVCAGGYPEAVRLPDDIRPKWCESYLETVIERDILRLGDLRRRSVLRPLIEWTAANTAGELNLQSVGGRLGIDRATVASYLSWMETVFMVHRIGSWSRNPRARPVRRPKLHITDTALAAALLGVEPQALARPAAPAAGALLETFVVNEIARSVADVPGQLRLHHYRDGLGHEVDLLIERGDGAVVAVEIKATSSPSAEHLRHVAWLRDRLDAAAPGTFKAGVLLHTGRQRYKVGDRLTVCPIDVLWR